MASDRASRKALKKEMAEQQSLKPDDELVLFVSVSAAPIKLGAYWFQ